MNREQALATLLEDAASNTNSLTSMRRVRRACQALDLSEQETTFVLYHLSYIDDNGELLPALRRKS
jgi:hypothetical protein